MSFFSVTQPVYSKTKKTEKNEKRLQRYGSILR